MSDPSRRGTDRASRLARAAALGGGSGKICPADRATQLLEAIIEPGDRVTIEGDNQKQADFLEHDESGRSGPLTSPLVGEVGSHRKMRSG